MTTKQKARAYDEAIRRAKEWFNPEEPDSYSCIVESIFPELAKSEDERIRKALIDYFDHANKIDENPLQGYDIHTDKVIAWLEKQCKQPHIDDLTAQETMGIAVAGDSEDEDGQKSADKFRPKFHKGQWITNGDYTWQIINVTDLDYILQSQDGNTVDDTISHVDEHFHSFTIQDAKDGDIIAEEPIKTYPSPFVAIYKKQNEEDFDSHCFIGFNGKFYEGEEGHAIEDVHPATKEQRDTLMKAMADAGFTFDFDKKKLKKIEQKSAWSEEDERMYSGLYNLIYATQYCDSRKEFSDWLKSLKDRYTWKPSDEQIDDL